MNRFFAQALVAVTLLSAPGLGRAGEPSAEEIVRSARMNPLGQEIRLQAQIRNDKAKTKIPFRIVVEDGAVKYQFDDPEQEIQLRLDEDGSELRERIGGKSGVVKPAKNEERVRGSNITYEDLALRVLYRPRAKLLGTEILRTRNCWKIEMQGGRDNSGYAAARLWIDRSNGALMRMEGFDMKGRKIKRFEVLSAQKIDGQWMLKSMKIESLNPETDKVTDRTYLEVLDKI